MLTAPAATVMRARRLRRAMSPAELKLWYALRERPGGYKFRKSHPAGFFALDFFCAQAKLAIEIDGESHERGDEPAFDEQRDRQLLTHGIATLRITGKDVFTNLEGVVTHIVETVRARLPLHHPPKGAGGPPPRAGEEKASPDPPRHGEGDRGAVEGQPYVETFLLQGTPGKAR